MRFRMSHSAGSQNEKGPDRAPPRSCREVGALGAEARRREGGEEAEGQQEHRGDPVEAAFEAREGHDTHLEFFSLNPGGAGLSVRTIGR